MITRAFREALQRTRRTLGDHCADWRWDDLQSVSMRHELGGVPLLGDWLSRGPYPWGGGPATLGRARYRYHQPFVARPAPRCGWWRSSAPV